MKMSEKLQEIKKDNKGFSLVELIIVIAIMAILIGIVGMNVIPQIENANLATDAQVLSAVVSEAMEAWTQVDYAADSINITVSYNASKSQLVFNGGTDENSKKVAAKITELEGTGKRVFKSKALKDFFTTGGSSSTPGTFTLTCDTVNGVILDVSACTKLVGYTFESR